MKKFNVITAIILSAITCGIYSLYLWYVVITNNNQIAANNNIPQISGFIKFILLSTVTCGIYGIYWYFKFWQQEGAILQAYGKPHVITGEPIVNLLLMFVPILSWYVLCESYNRGVDGYMGM